MFALLLVYPFIIIMHLRRRRLRAAHRASTSGSSALLGVIYHFSPSTRRLDPQYRVHPIWFLPMAVLMPTAYLMLTPLGLFTLTRRAGRRAATGVVVAAGDAGCHGGGLVIVAAHQPHYLPWLGYLAKIAAADLFVVMDDLQYEAQNFQNRNRVKVNNGAAWLTVPLERGAQDERICDKRIDNGGSRQGALAAPQPGRRCASTTAARPSSPLRSRAGGDLHAPLGRAWSISTCTCCSCTCAGSRSARRWCWPRRWSCAGRRPSASSTLCRAVGADVYLSGGGGSRGYLDVDAARARRRAVAWQRFAHPVYPQRYPALGFVSHLGALDLLFNCGPEARACLRDAMAEPARRPQAAVR